MPVEPCSHLERIVLDAHVQRRIPQRGGDMEVVKTRVRRAHARWVALETAPAGALFDCAAIHL